MADNNNSSILETIAQNEKLVLINAFYSKDIRKDVSDLNVSLFLNDFSKSLFKSLNYFKGDLDNGDSIDFDGLELKMSSFGESIKSSTLKDVFEYTEKKESLKHQIIALQSNKAKITLLDGDNSLIDQFKTECNRPYEDNHEELVKIYDKMGKALSTYGNRIELATRIDVEKYAGILEERKNFKYKTFGIKEVDEYMTYGAIGGDITFIVGRPSQGKSLVSNKMSRGVADSGILDSFNSTGGDKIRPHSALYLVEMAEAGYIDRQIGGMTGIPIKEFTKNFHGDEQGLTNKLMGAVQHLADNPYFHISDEGTMSYQKWIDDVKRLQDLIGQEYLVVTVDLFTKLSDFFGTELQTTTIADRIFGQLKSDVKKMGIHVIGVAQLNRQGAFKGKLREPSDLEGFYPKIEDIKGFGAIEEASDNILTVNRPYKIAKENDCDFLAEISDDIVITIPKQRGGVTGEMVRLGFHAETTNLFSLKGHEKNIQDLDSLEVETLMDMNMIQKDSAEL